jgi:hypothetical protein
MIDPVRSKARGMRDAELRNSNNWLDFGLIDYFHENPKFPTWLDIGNEVARIVDAEEGSPFHALLLTVAAASARVGVECDNCGAHVKPRCDCEKAGPYY